MSVGVAVVTREGIVVAADSYTGWFEYDGHSYTIENHESGNGAEIIRGVPSFKKPYVSIGGSHKMWGGERCAAVFTSSGTSERAPIKEIFLRLASIQAEKAEPRHAIETVRRVLQDTHEPNMSISCLLVGYDSTDDGPIPRVRMFTKPPSSLGSRSHLREGEPMPMYGKLETGAVMAVGQWEYLFRLFTPMKWGQLEMPTMDPAKLNLQQGVDLCALYMDHCMRWQRLVHDGHTHVGAPFDLCIMRPGEDAAYATLGALSDASGRLSKINM